MVERGGVLRARGRTGRYPSAGQGGSGDCRCVHATPRRRAKAARGPGRAPANPADRDFGAIPRGTGRNLRRRRPAWRPTGDREAVFAARPARGRPSRDRPGNLSARGQPMSQASTSRSLLADARLAARLRFWIVIIGVIAIAAIAGSSAYDSWHSYRHVISATTRELGNLAKALAEQANDTLRTSYLLLRDTVTWYETERPAPGPAADDKLAARATGLPQVREVRIIDQHGTPRFRSRELTADSSSLADRAYFIAHRDHPRLGVVLSDPLITQIEHRPAVVMSRRLDRRDGGFDGIVQAIFDLQEFERVYQAIDLGKGSAINLLRDDGALVLRQPPPPSAQATRNQFPELVVADSASAGVLVSPIDQIPRFVGVAHLAQFPLVVAVTREQSVVLAGWRAEAYR